MRRLAALALLTCVFHLAAATEGRAEEAPAPNSRPASGIAPGSEAGSEETGLACEANASRPVGEFLVINNKHGEHRLSKDDSYVQCIGTSDGGFPVSWQWDIETEEPLVKGFPQISFGTNPWTRIPSTGRMPVRLSNLTRLYFTHQVDVTADGIHNLAFDLWITEDDTPEPDERTHEVMIWLDGNMPPGLPRENEVKIGGAMYNFYRTVNEDGVQFLLFVSQAPRPNGRTNIAMFLYYLLANGMVPLDSYLSTVTLGTEMWDGSGNAKVSEYKVSFSGN